MAFSSATPTTIVAVTLLLLQTSASMAQQRGQPTFLFSLCDENAGKYTTGTIFSTNLNLLLTTLTSGKLSTTGHFVGDIPDRVYGLVVCSDDVDTATCRTCLSRASQDVKHRCPFRKAATVWYDKCQLRYSNSTFNSPVDESNLKVDMVKTSRISTPTYATQNPSPVMAPPTTSPTNSAGENSGDGKRKRAVASSIAYFVVIIASLLFFLFRFLWRKMSTKKPYPNEDWEETLSTASLLYNLQTVKNATNNFSESNKLGEGGFGPVYKGKLEDGQEIAVKRLSATSGQGLEELRNEVVLLARVQHRKLVRLLGICLEEEEKLLVYEYMPNRSLDTILFDLNKNKLLCWKKRYNIIEGIARGLFYLHEESHIKIIHRDLKASNVLLDADMDPKISDFGMARLFGGDQTQAKTKRVVGTFGYMSPEYAIRGHFSSKSDVFSFGVIVLEIVTGQRNADSMTCDNSTGLLSHVWEHWSSGTASELVDPSLGGNYTEDEALRCIEVGLHCVQEVPSARPTMSAVLLMLNSKSEFDRVPSQPPFPNGINRGKSIANEGFVSRNHISITVLDPR